MREWAKLRNGEGNVALLAGNQNAPNLQERVAGAKEEAAKYPNINVIGTFYHIETPQDAAAEVLRVNNAYPELDGWAFIGGWPLFTKTLLNDLDPEKYTVVSSDGLPPELPYVAEGTVSTLAAYTPYDWGYYPVKLIIDKIYLKKDVPEINPMEVVIVTKENLGEWARLLKSQGFEDVPEEYLTIE